MHFLLCGGRQSNWPPLFCPLRSVDGKGVFRVIEHRDQDGDLIDEGMEVLDRVVGNTRLKKKQIGEMENYRHRHARTFFSS